MCLNRPSSLVKRKLCDDFQHEGVASLRGCRTLSVPWCGHGPDPQCTAKGLGGHLD